MGPAPPKPGDFRGFYAGKVIRYGMGRFVLCFYGFIFITPYLRSVRFRVVLRAGTRNQSTLSCV